MQLLIRWPTGGFWEMIWFEEKSNSEARFRSELKFKKTEEPASR